MKRLCGGFAQAADEHGCGQAHGRGSSPWRCTKPAQVAPKAKPVYLAPGVPKMSKGGQATQHGESDQAMSDQPATGRRIALSIPVFMANAFLLVTLASATLGIVDGLLLKSAMDSSLFGVRMQLSGLAGTLGFIVLAALILVPHLPKLTLLPAVLALLWQLAGAPGVTWSMNDPSSLVPLEAVSLAAVLFGLMMNRLTYGTLLIRAADLPYYERLAVRTLIAAPIAALVLIIVPVVAVITAIPVMIEQQTGGYLKFGPEGLEVRQTIMAKGPSEVHLVGMVHIGEPEFYRDLYKSIPPQALVLAEGVTDRKGVMKTSPNYENAARGLGLESQDEFQQLLSTSNRLDLPPPAEGAPAPAVDPAKPFVVFADMDISDLTEATRRFIEAVGGVFRSASFDEALQKYMAVTQTFTQGEMMKAMDELIIARNRKALENFDRYAPRFSVIYLPWGAGHMPDFEKQLKARGYVVKSSDTRQIARYDTILEAMQSIGRPPAATPPAPAAAPVPAN